MADDNSAQNLESWATAYGECYQLYLDDKLEECIDIIESHLLDSSVPLYHRMKFETTLAAVLDDWYEADDALTRCEDLWQSTCAYYQQHGGGDEIVQEGLNDIRELLDGVRIQHDALPRRIEYRGDDADVMEEDEEDEEHWGDDAELDEGESDVDEEDGEDEVEGSEVEPSSKANEDDSLKSGEIDDDHDSGREVRRERDDAVREREELRASLDAAREEISRLRVELAGARGRRIPPPRRSSEGLAFREKDAGNNKATADTKLTTITEPTAVEKVATTVPTLPKLESSGGQLLAPDFHEALHDDANNATADDETTDNTADNKITDSKTSVTELVENKREVKLEPDGTRGLGENKPAVKTESKEPDGTRGRISSMNAQNC
jgi:hypothetical protein